MTNPLRKILTQQLRTEELLGIRSVPLVLAPVSPQQRPIRSEVERPAPLLHQSVPRPQAAHAAADANLARLKILDDSKVKGCTKCELSAGRTQTVFGQGSPIARIVFVGEGPGYEEDKQGLAFVGPAGQLLTKMIVAMGLSRDEVYICNVVKCRPPGNRTPSAEEILACSPYLHEQLAIIQPEMIIALGAPAAKTLLNTAESIGKLRGRFHQYIPPNAFDATSAIPVMPTYHPAYLLRNPEDKRKVWDDLQLVMARMGLNAKTTA